MNRQECADEMEIIDLAAGRLPSNRSKLLHSHISQCKACFALYQEWMSLLPTGNHESTEILPANEHKRRVRRHWRTIRAANTLKRLAPYAAGAAAAVWISLVAVQSGSNSPSGKTDRLLSNPVQLLANHPQTSAIHVPVANTVKPLHATVLVNEATGELAVAAYGLSPINDHDYQAWLGSTGKLRSGGLLSLQNGMLQLYVSGPDIVDSDDLMVSIEPKGGSGQPTGPIAMYAKLKSEKYQ